MRKGIFIAAILLAAVAGIPAKANASEFGNYSEEALLGYLELNAETIRKTHVPMRDGVNLDTDIYLPRTAQEPLGTVFVRTPYNFNPMGGSTLRLAAEAVSRGFAFVIQNERGRYFSEGKFEILGYPRTDGSDALTWIASQEWSNGKVGTVGCSSSAEWQLALAAENHPAHAAMVPMAAGAGIGKVGAFREQGNWFRGGVQRTLFFPWLYHVDNPLRAQIPPGLDQPTRARLSRYNDLAADKPKVVWKDHIHYLPVKDMLSALGEPAGTFEDLITRTPTDPAWEQGGLYHDTASWGVPALWFNSWYDISMGPNMALFNHVREKGIDAETRAHQYAVIAPVPHCKFWSLGPNTKTGARDMGDTTFDTAGEVFGFFDRFLRGNDAAFPDGTPKVRYYSMGQNRWNESAAWPPPASKPVKLYLRSSGGANSLYGNGMLSFDPPAVQEPADTFTYDPLNPVPTVGGGDCCNGGTVIPGAFDQRPVEARQDVLVYTSPPLEESMTVTGFIGAFLSVSSDAKDTDFAVKLVDVTPDGTAWIIDDTIFRARYRNGYDKPTMMEHGKIYGIDFTPMTTSIVFGKGHRIRVEVTSSNFPKFVRNLNTGGDVVSETEAVTANNSVHHSAENPSYLILQVQK